MNGGPDAAGLASPDGVARALVGAAPIPALLLRGDGGGGNEVAYVNGPARALLGEPVPSGVVAALTAIAAGSRGGVAEGRVEPRSTDGSVLPSFTGTVVPLGGSLLGCWLQPCEEVPASVDLGLDVDAVTGLLTDRAVPALIARAAARSRQDGLAYSVARVDVHPPGGGVLTPDQARITARQLQQAVRDDDAVARLAPNEFLLLLHWRVDEPALESFEERLRGSLTRSLDDGEPGAVVHVGVLATPDPGLEPVAVLAAAEQAVGATEPGRPVVLGRSHGRPSITATSVDRALEQRQLRLYFQPVADVTDGRAAGAEALVRWQHPELGLLSPAQFLPAVDAAGGLIPLGEWVLETAIRQASAWGAVADLDYYRIGVNLAPRQLEHSDVPALVDDLLRRYDVPGQRFIIEIVESEALTERAVVARRVRELMDLGLRVAIDDFGSGFANMSYLRDLPVDLVKVDRALVGVRPTRRDEAILGAVVAVAAAVGADVLLEGIEHQDQIDLARRVGVRFGQGLLLGVPIEPGPRPPLPTWPGSSPGGRGPLPDASRPGPYDRFQPDGVEFHL